MQPTATLQVTDVRHQRQMVHRPNAQASLQSTNLVHLLGRQQQHQMEGIGKHAHPQQRPIARGLLRMLQAARMRVRLNLQAHELHAKLDCVCLCARVLVS